MSTLPTPDPRPPPRGTTDGSRLVPSRGHCPDDESSPTTPDRIVRLAKLIAAVGVALGGLAKLIDVLVDALFGG